MGKESRFHQKGAFPFSSPRPALSGQEGHVFQESLSNRVCRPQRKAGTSKDSASKPRLRGRLSEHASGVWRFPAPPHMVWSQRGAGATVAQSSRQMSFSAPDLAVMFPKLATVTGMGGGFEPECLPGSSRAFQDWMKHGNSQNDGRCAGFGGAILVTVASEV